MPKGILDSVSCDICDGRYTKEQILARILAVKKPNPLSTPHKSKGFKLNSNGERFLLEEYSDYEKRAVALLLKKDVSELTQEDVDDFDYFSPNTKRRWRRKASERP